MPLMRSKEEFIVTMLGVKFLMRDGTTEVACRAARELLRFTLGSRNRQEDGEMFKNHRDAIEQAASDKYDADMLEAHSDARIVITETDIASPLSKKM
jgi:hypothetical protein